MKILTLNLHNANRWSERFSLVITLLGQEQPDVIALQQVWLPIDQAACIAHQLNRQTVERPYACYLVPKQGDHPQEGIALLSRYPVIRHDWTNLPGGNRVGQYITWPTPMVAEQYPGITMTVDYILFTAAKLRVRDARIVGHTASPADELLYPSDHYGLVAEFQVMA